MPDNAGRSNDGLDLLISTMLFGALGGFAAIEAHKGNWGTFAWMAILPGLWLLVVATCIVVACLDRWVERRRPSPDQSAPSADESHNSISDPQTASLSASAAGGS